MPYVSHCTCTRTWGRCTSYAAITCLTAKVLEINLSNLYSFKFSNTFILNRYSCIPMTIEIVRKPFFIVSDTGLNVLNAEWRKKKVRKIKKGNVKEHFFFF